MPCRKLSLLLTLGLCLGAPGLYAAAPAGPSAAVDSTAAAAPSQVQVIPAPAAGPAEMVFTVRKTVAGQPETASALSQLHVRSAPVVGGYTVIVSRATADDPQWGPVVKALAFKRRARTLVYDGPVAGVRDELSREMPRYACFVARPEEAGRDFVISISRMTRKLDADPYTDVIWAILTGYDATDAMRIVAQNTPLVIRRAAAGTSIPLNEYDEGVWYDENRKDHKVSKGADGKIVDGTCPDDTTTGLVDALNDFKPDVFVTSGHASERVWQIGYTYPDGTFQCKDGVVYGVDTAHHAHAVYSPNPKVYLPIGNCLMGHIIDKQSMALAFMGSAGVDQMVGYVVETWYGYGGWGILDYFQGQPGRFTLAESFYLNNQALVYRLRHEFPKGADLDPDVDGANSIDSLMKILGYTQFDARAKDNVGLLYDRDVVALYGDPAWDARMAPRKLAWDQSLTVRKGVYTFTIKANEDSTPARPPMALLPARVKNITVLQGRQFDPVITDNFLLLPNPTHLEKGKTYQVVFRAEKA